MNVMSPSQVDIPDLRIYVSEENATALSSLLRGGAWGQEPNLSDGTITHYIAVRGALPESLPAGVLRLAKGFAYTTTVAENGYNVGRRTSPAISIMHTGCYLDIRTRYYADLVMTVDEYLNGAGDWLQLNRPSQPPQH